MPKTEDGGFLIDDTTADIDYNPFEEEAELKKEEEKERERKTS